MGKSTFCICEKKDADQLQNQNQNSLLVKRQNDNTSPFAVTDQRICFRYIDSRSTIPLLS